MRNLAKISMMLLAFGNLSFAQESVEIYQVEKIVIKKEKGELPYALVGEKKLKVDFNSLGTTVKSFDSDDSAELFKFEAREAFISNKAFYNEEGLVFLTSVEGSVIINDCKNFETNCNPIIKLNSERVYLNTQNLTEENKELILTSSVFDELKANVKGYYSKNEKNEKLFNIVDIEFVSKDEMTINSEEELFVSANLL